VLAFTCLLIAAALGSRYAGRTLVVTVPVSQPDAVISLASHEWERLPAAAVMAAQHMNAIVLLTLPQGVNSFNCHDCAGRPGVLRKLGVAPGRIHILPLAVSNTYGEALATLAFARQNRIRHLLVVTSPYHTRRSLAAFRFVFDGTGVEVGVVPALETSPAQPEKWWFSGYDRAYVCYEWAAIVYYALHYGIL
jgi:uncharacterized SAM-binding protein YcdF (DUF218 family)